MDVYSVVISANEIGVAGSSKAGHALAGIRLSEVRNALVGVEGSSSPGPTAARPRHGLSVFVRPQKGVS